MADEQANINLRMALDRAALQQAQDGVTALDKRLSDLKAHVGDTGVAADKGIRSLADAFKASAGSIDASTKSLAQMRSQLDGVISASAKAQSGGGFGVEGLRRTGGALTQLGLSGPGSAISRVGDIAQVGKELGNVGDAIGKMGISTGQLLAVAGPVGLALGAVVVAFGLFNDAIKEAQKNVESAIAATQSFYDFLAKGGTTKDAQARVKALEDIEKPAREAQLKAARDALNNGLAQYGLQPGTARQIADKLPGLGLLYDNLDKAEKNLTDVNNTLGSFEGALKGTDLAANDARAALEKQVEAYAKTADDQVRIQQEANQLISGGSKKAVDDRIRALTEEGNAIKGQLRDFPEVLLQTEKGQQLYTQLAERLKSVNGELDTLKTKVKGIVDAKDALDKFFEGLKKNADRIAKEVNERNDRVAATQQKYEDDVARIEEQSLAKRTEIEKQYATKLVDIARKAADDSAAALQKLQQQREDLATSLGRDLSKDERDAAVKRLDIQINAQREETRAYQQHQRELEQIRKDAYAREVGFLLDRNFLGLYQSRLQTSRDIERSNEQFTGDRGTRREDIANQLQDLQRSIQQQRQERLIAYQQQLQDAQTAYKRELQLVQQRRIAELELARQTEQAALRDAQNAATNELRIRKAAYDKELQLVSLYGAAYVAANDKIQQALITRAEQRLAMINGASGGSTNTVIGGDMRRLLQRAAGGGLNRGDVSLVNERGREGFNGVPFPPGLGVFMPVQSGTVQPGEGRVIQATFNIRSNDPAGVRRECLDMLEQVMGK